MASLDVNVLSTLILGMVAMASLVASLAFLRFWRITSDRFFALFALSFALLAANRIALALIPAETEGRTFLYWIRLFAYLMILLAILDKNRPKKAI